MSGDPQQPKSPAERKHAEAGPPAAYGRTYREAAEELRRALGLLEQLREEPEGPRRREQYRSLRRLARRGFRRLQQARRGEAAAAGGGSAAGEGGRQSAGGAGQQQEAAAAAAEAEQLFTRLLLAGGEGLLEQEESRGDVRETVAGALAAALRTYLQPDDRYRPFIELERLPEWLQRLLSIFFPVLLGPRSGRNPSTGELEPTGIDDPEDEEVRRTGFIRLPLGQAKELLAEEVIPRLEERVSRSGAAEDEEALQRARRRLEELEAIRIEPRAKPFVPERGFYTEQITRFSPQGELLVSLRLPGIVRSGTNMDRVRELVKMELVWRLAGKGVCRALDEELEYIRSLDSGSAGSWFLPRSKMEVEKSFGYLRRSFPLLAMLDSREGLRRLLAGTAEALRGGGGSLLRRRVRALLDTELPAPEEREEEE